MKSHTYALLTSIWSGDTRPAESERALPLYRLITGLLPIHSVILRVPEGPLSGRVFTDDTELMPSLPLGDVIEEEFSTSVAAGTLVICCSEAALAPACSMEKRSELLGCICAEVIIDTVLLGHYPIEFEMEAFQHLAVGVVATAMSVYADHDGIILSQFALALARRLDMCLIGSCADRDANGPFVRRLCGPALDLSSSTVLDGVLENNNCFDLSSWASDVAGRMTVQLDLPLSPVVGGGKEASKSIF